MSSRQLRKLQQQRELEQAKVPESQYDNERAAGDEGEADSDVLPANKPNLFANFAALQVDEYQDDDSDGDGKAVEDEAQTGQIDEQFGPPNVDKKSKKHKKKKKTNPVEGNKPISSVPDSRSGGRQDEIDAALQELNLKGGTRSVGVSVPETDPTFERISTMLSINTQHLKVANEMRNLFGRTAIENHDDAGGPVPRGARRRQRAAQQQVDLETALKGHHAPGKGLPELTLRRNIFIQGKDDWPRANTGGLTMGIVHTEDSFTGIVEFRFVHDKAYNQIQEQFHVFVEMGDPQNLIGLLQRNPYNISLLLQVSKIAKDQTDHALSSDLVERALFTFGRASQSLFATKLSQGKARLGFDRPENREFWLAGYQYIKSLVMKGTYRSALEWAKVLLALEPETDPYCMLLMIHHLALRAFESQFVLDVFETRMDGAWSAYVVYMAPSSALAAMQLKESARARYLLKDSIRRLPWLFCRLFQELNLQNPPPSIWGAEPRSNAEDLFSEIYIRQTKDLWNTPEATSLLMEVAHAADKLDYSGLPILDNATINLNVARFVYLDNTPALMALVPSQLLHRIVNSDSDPLPPEENIFSWPSQEAFLSHNDSSTGMHRAFGDRFNPLAAIRALIPALGARDGEPPITNNELREYLEAEANRQDARAAAGTSDNELEEEENSNNNDDDNELVDQTLANSARRLHEFFFGSRIGEQSEGSHNVTEPGSHDQAREQEREREDDDH